MKTKESHFAVVKEAKKYDLNSIVLAGKGVDRYIDYLEYKDGTPLTESEIESILDNYELHAYLIN